MRRSVMRIAATAALALGAELAAAQERPAEHPVVLELFTSQGCSSCPPADDLLAELAGREGVLALAYHVDYWNYLGWRDTWSTSASTRRQKDYAKLMGQRMVYTPQLVVDGRWAVVGSDKAAVARAIADAERIADRDATLTLAASHGRAVATARLDGGGALVLVIYGAGAPVEIEAGENAGRSVATTNPVIAWRRLGEVGPVESRWSEPIPAEAAGVAALMHGPDGAIVAAAHATAR